MPLLALLRNTPLTEDQIKEVVREIADEEAKAPPGHEIDHDEIEKFIEGVAHHDGGPGEHPARGREARSRGLAAGRTSAARSRSWRYRSDAVSMTNRYRTSLASVALVRLVDVVRCR